MIDYALHNRWQYEKSVNDKWIIFSDNKTGEIIHLGKEYYKARIMENRTEQEYKFFVGFEKAKEWIEEELLMDLFVNEFKINEMQNA